MSEGCVDTFQYVFHLLFHNLALVTPLLISVSPGHFGGPDPSYRGHREPTNVPHSMAFALLDERFKEMFA